MPKRACGDSREQDALYAICPTGVGGKPVEHFLIDPVIPWEGEKTLRAPMLVPSNKDQEINNVIIGIGKESYPYISDYIEEVRIMGVSKRFPRDFPVKELTSGKSYMIFMHPRGIPDFVRAILPFKCPKKIKEPHQCIGELWSLSFLEEFEGKHEIEVMIGHNKADIKTPSVKYRIFRPLMPENFKNADYKHGLFASFPIHHFEYVNRNNEMPENLAERFKETKWKLEVVEE